MLVFEDIDLHGSSSITAAAFDREEHVLQITFRSKDGSKDRTYNYSGVPSDALDELLAAKSHGEFVNREIKPHYGAKQVA